jgi:hypothetical protein
MRNQILATVWAILMFSSCADKTGAALGNGGDAGLGDVGESGAALVIRAQEGHACTTDPAEHVQVVCSPSMELVCIATYSRLVTNPQEAMRFDGGIRQVFVCRSPCSTTSECPQQGDICCAGQIYGKTFDKKGGCVPPGSCEAPDVSDAGP